MSLPPRSFGSQDDSNWDELDFRHLKFAVMVAEKQSFTHAADHLQVDQGLLSRQIKWLEGKVGFKLFDRTQRPLVLTEAGQKFLNEARFILSQTEQAIEQAQQINRGERGRLTIGINTSIANSKLPDILKVFYKQYPNVMLTLQELASYDQIEKLKKQQLDVGFFHSHNLRRLEDSDENIALASKTVLKEPLVLVLPETHRIAKRSDSISLAILSNEQFILPPANLLYGLRDQIDRLCLEAGFKPHVRQEAAWISTVLSLVAGGVGISILPANVQTLRRTDVIYRAIKGETPILEIAAIWRRDNHSTALSNFLSILDAV